MATTKYLDSAGVTYLWSKIKQYVGQITGNLFAYKKVTSGSTSITAVEGLEEVAFEGGGSATVTLTNQAATQGTDAKAIVTVTTPTKLSDFTADNDSQHFTQTEKTKLSGIATGAEVNQNAFSNVKVGSTTVAADAKTDTVEFAVGTGADGGLIIEGDATNDKVTIKGKSETAASGGTDLSMVTTGEKYTWNNKQNALTFDTTPTESSTNPVTSGGVNSALFNKADRTTVSPNNTPTTVSSGPFKGAVRWSFDSAQANAIRNLGTYNSHAVSVMVTDYNTMQYLSFIHIPNDAQAYSTDYSVENDAMYFLHWESNSSLGLYRIEHPFAKPSAIPSAYTSLPAMNGTAKAGSSTNYAKGDHVHPSDTTKADKVTGATANNLAALDANGNLIDSGVSATSAGTDTKNTAGATTDSSKLFLVGAKDHGANPQTYTNDNVYATNGALHATTYNDLTLTKASTGFTISGGTTSKTLTVNESYTLAAASAKGVDTSITAGSTSTNLPTTAAVESRIKSAIETAQAGAAMYQGAAPTTFAPTNYKAGYYWVVKTAGTYVGQTCEPGDMIFANTDSATYNASHFDVVQTNLDIAAMTNSDIDTAIANAA
jgi:hypothetical protein